MVNLSIYLLFENTCKSAMEFYQTVFGGELTVTLVNQTAVKDFMSLDMQEKVINARLLADGIDISASDWLRPDETPVQGNKVCLYLSGGSFAELNELFDKLAKNGNVTEPLKEEFFGVYGAMNDQFGVRWMFHANK